MAQAKAGGEVLPRSALGQIVATPAALAALAEAHEDTTSRYMRTVTDRMKEAIRNLGASPGGKSGGNSLRKKAQSSVLMKLAIEGLRARKARERNGGRSRT